jgi:hypothetical protein
VVTISDASLLAIDLGHLDRREPRVDRRLHQRGLVAGQLELDDLDAVGQVHAHARRRAAGRGRKRVGQAVGALVEFFVGDRRAARW